MAILNQEIPDKLKQKLREEKARTGKYEKEIVVDILSDYFRLCK